MDKLQAVRLKISLALRFGSNNQISEYLNKLFN